MSVYTTKVGMRIFKIILVLLLVLGIFAGAFLVYVGNYYHADMTAIDAFLPMQSVNHSEKDGHIVFMPENPIAGFVFYPGGKVEYTAYMPLMAALADRGIICVLVKMPFNLAVLDVNAADGIREQYPEVEKWYIGGHSLGGSMAASYLAKHRDGFEGLVLLGAYSTADLSDSGLRVLSVYGSEDGVMNREKYEKNLTNLPDNFTEIVIDGGIHAYFGMYGRQKGDGEPRISNEEQIFITADIIFDTVK